MDAHFVITGFRLGVALSVSLAMNAAGVGYLAKTEPAPLRFRITPAQKPLGFSVLPQKAVNPPAEAANAAELKSPAPPAVDPSPEMPSPSVPLEPASGTSNPQSLLPQVLARSPDSHSSTPAANELLTVNPQMLIEYFKPMGGWTNGTGVSVEMPVNFTPAVPSSLPSSRATYKTE